MKGPSLQLATIFAFAAMVALLCLCVAYLTMLALGRSDAVLVGLASLFAMVIFSVGTSVVRSVKRRTAAQHVMFGKVNR